MKRRRILWFPVILIILGVLFLGKNLGFIDEETFHLIISWQMLIIVFGVTQLFHRSYISGSMFILVGGFFMLSKAGIIYNDYEIKDYWPVLLIVLGISLLFSRSRWRHSALRNRNINQENAVITDGFVKSDNTFNGTNIVVLDPIFRGAELKNVFGGMKIDLRRTKLETEKTYIDVTCTFSGIELYVPESWNIQSQISTMIGGCDDERSHFNAVIDNDHVVILRGNITFGGIEIKN